MRTLLFPIALVVCLIFFAACKKSEDGPKEDEELKSLGEGALAYFQEEHMDPNDPIKVVTKVFPAAVNPICIKEGKSDDGEVFKQLRYSGVTTFEVCYQSNDTHTAFRAYSQVDGKIHLCLKGSSDGGVPKLSNISEDKCEMPK
ncbi:MAG: hypothetical protein RBU37_05790 [Myxococcota bacterium]|jgi:hypothetical protein|nr:hypothetical protein [Myxococcota bacterium]